jgi:uncharacterized protein (DUF433 family)
MTLFDFRNIEKVIGRCGGRAVIANTRLRVCIVLRCYRQNMSVEEIVQYYPQIRPADVHDAIAYAFDHPEEMEKDLLADNELWAKSQITD